MRGPAQFLDRREAVAALLRDRGDLLVISGLGSATYDVAACGDHPRNFYLWGAMGGAAVMGLGLALARPGEQVLVLTGDGEQLMGMGALATIGVKRPKNLSIVVLDNGLYGETGQQQSHTHHGTRLTEVARACGFENTALVTESGDIDTVRDWTRSGQAGPSLAVFAIGQTMPERVLPSRDGVFLKNRFRQALDIES